MLGRGRIGGAVLAPRIELVEVHEQDHDSLSRLLDAE